MQGCIRHTAGVMPRLLAATPDATPPSDTSLPGALPPNARQSTIVPVFADCMLEAGMPRNSDDVPANLINPLPFRNGTGPITPGPKGSMAYFCIDRHHKAVNAVFLDGHAARVPLEELWQLKWNEDFQPRQVVLPR
ncbi:MAG TPA: hypothetical protein VFC78_25240 [Tepidisphaeraceae bacterium]|nr:hypothetical protein [Tepidisphaeraceae bacterium]